VVNQLANRLASTHSKTRSQHSHLEKPLTQLLQACRPRSSSLDGPYPALDITDALAQTHRTLLSGLLDLETKLCALETTLRQVDAMRTLTLARIEGEIEGVGRLLRLLRRFEEGVKRFLRVQAGPGGGGRREVIRRVRDEFSPAMRDAICSMNLLAARVQFADLELVRMARGSRVTG
jgi:hypothetical protein